MQHAFEMEAARANAEFEHDLAAADGMSQLPPPGALQHLVRVTDEALYTPAICTRVMALAEELECAGDMADQLNDYLPDLQAGWPAGIVVVMGGPSDRRSLRYASRRVPAGCPAAGPGADGGPQESCRSDFVTPALCRRRKSGH